MPKGFSYGPTIEKTLPTMAAEGSPWSGIVFGYGFGSTTFGAATPPDLQITFDGKPASVTNYAPLAYGPGSPPFPLQAATYTMSNASSGSQDTA